MALQTDFTIAPVFEIASLESTRMRTYPAACTSITMALFARIAICMACLALLQASACFSGMFKPPSRTLLIVVRLESKGLQTALRKTAVACGAELLIVAAVTLLRIIQ